MNNKLRQRKQAIRSFMREHYTDERLAMLLAHAQEGKLRHESCCCFAMIPTVTHHLISGMCSTPSRCGPYEWIQIDASVNFNFIAHIPEFAADAESADCKRRRILIPMVRAEMRRRDRLAMSNQEVRQVPIPSELATKVSA